MTGVISTIPKHAFIDNAGLPAVGYKLYTYLAGSLTPATTYQDQGLSSANTNPIVLDARGECVIWLDSTKEYKFIMKTPVDVSVWSVDDISGTLNATDINSLIAAQTAALNAHIAALATSSGSSLVGFIQSGTGAVIRTLQDKDRELSSVKDFGAKGDGVTDDYAAFVACLSANAGKTIFVPDPSVSYKIGTGTITIPANTILAGAGKSTTKLLHAFNGDMFILKDGAGIQDIYLEGDGANYSGRGLVIGGTDGRQNVTNAKIINFNGFPLDFTSLSSGSQSIFQNCSLYYYGSTTGSANVAVNMLAGLQVSAVPRSFIGIQTLGGPSFNFGGANGVFVTCSFLSDLIYTSNSRDVTVSTSRISNQVSLVVDGHNNCIVGCDIGPQVTISTGADAITIGPGSYNNLPIIDNSGNNRNNLYHWSIAYTPTLTSGGTQPTLGDGSISGMYSRNGSTVTVTINLAIGSTTNLGTGGLFLGLPFYRSSMDIPVAGVAEIVLGSGAIYSCYARIVQNTNKCELIRDTSGSVTFNSPGSFVAGGSIRATLTYSV